MRFFLDIEYNLSSTSECARSWFWHWPSSLQSSLTSLNLSPDNFNFNTPTVGQRWKLRFIGIVADITAVISARSWRRFVATLLRLRYAGHDVYCTHETLSAAAETARMRRIAMATDITDDGK